MSPDGDLPFVILTAAYIASFLAGLALVAVGGWKNYRAVGLNPTRTAAVARPWVFGGLALMGASVGLLMFGPQ